jgi:hypothetical protein
MNISSSQIIYSEHGEDECFEYRNGKGRVFDGGAIGYVASFIEVNGEWISTSAKLEGEIKESLILFDDIKYSEYDHKYWDDYELEYDQNRIVI